MTTITTVNPSGPAPTPLPAPLPAKGPVTPVTEELRFSGLPVGARIHITYGAGSGWGPRPARVGADGKLRLSAPLGHALTLQWQTDGRPVELTVAPVGARASVKLSGGGAAAQRLPLRRMPGGPGQRAVASVALQPAPAPVSKPLPAGGFRTPPATVDAAGHVQQPPLAAGLDPRQAVMVVGDSLSDDAFYKPLFDKPPVRTWAGQLEATLAKAAAKGGDQRYVMSVARHGETVLAGRFSGQQKAGLLARLTAALDANPTPGTVVLALGANDFRAGTSAARVGQELRRAIDLIAQRSPATRIVLVGNRFPSDYGGGSNAARAQRVEDYARMYDGVATHLEATAARTGAAWAFEPDLFKQLRGSDGRIKDEFRRPGDPVHPNGSGQAAMLKTLLPTLGRPAPARSA